MFQRTIFVSDNYFGNADILTPGYQAVLTVPHDHQLFITIQKRSLYRCIDLHTSLLSYFGYNTSGWIQLDLCRLTCRSPPLQRPNAAVNGVQQAKTKK